MAIAVALCGAGISSLTAIEAKYIDSGKDGVKNIHCENEYLSVFVSAASGARITSLYDKLNKRECVKQLSINPSEGLLNEIRLEGSFKEGENPVNRAVFDLSFTKTSEKVVVTAKLDSYVLDSNDDEIPVRFIKKYTIFDKRSVILIECDILNLDTTRTIHLMPWLKNMLHTKKEKEPFVSFASNHGIYRSDHIVPSAEIASGKRDYRWNGKNLHFFPAGNWSSITTRPMKSAESGTISMVAQFGGLWKLYFWRKFYDGRLHENFITQESILTLKTAEPGKMLKFSYYMTVSKPLAAVVYCSSDLNIGLTPQPTGIDSNVKELTLRLASLRDLEGLRMRYQLETLDGFVIERKQTDIPALSPKKIVDVKIPVLLEKLRNYRLVLDFYKDGEPYFPGQAIDDSNSVIIPIVTDTEFTDQEVFKSQTGESNLPKILTSNEKAPVLMTNGSFSAYAFLASQRCFKEYVLTSANQSEIKIHAMAGEYESTQIVFVPKKDLKSLTISATDPVDNDGARIKVDRIATFIYPETTQPSFYSPKYLIGAYPEALVSCEKIFFDTKTTNVPVFITYKIPFTAPPGDYKGEIILKSQKGAEFTLPVNVCVWNIKMPRLRTIAVSSDMKSFNKDAIHKTELGLDGAPLREAATQMFLKYGITPYGYAAPNLENPESWDKALDQIESLGLRDIGLGNLNKVIAKYGNARVREFNALLEKRGMVKRFYIRTGFDEASLDLIPKIKEVCVKWKKLSGIPIMETYYANTPKELYGYLDIYCTGTERKKWKDERIKHGDRFFGVNLFPQRLEESPWSGRRLYWRAFDSHVTGSYFWTINKWDVREWGENWWTLACSGNLEACLVWPSDKGLIPTIRLEAVRDGIEDHALLSMLRDAVVRCRNIPAKKSLVERGELFLVKYPSDAIHSAHDLESLRLEAGDILSNLNM